MLQTRLEPLAITEQVPEASAFTRSSTLIVRRDGTILASENHNRGDISTGNLFDSVKVAGITDEVVEQMCIRDRAKIPFRRFTKSGPYSI